MYGYIVHYLLWVVAQLTQYSHVRVYCSLSIMGGSVADIGFSCTGISFNIYYWLVAQLTQDSHVWVYCSLQTMGVFSPTALVCPEYFQQAFSMLVFRIIQQDHDNNFLLNNYKIYFLGASWVATIPFSMGLTALIYYIAQKILLGQSYTFPLYARVGRSWTCTEFLNL